MSKTWDESESRQDYERLRELTKERRKRQEAKRRANDVRLKNWGRGDKTINAFEAFVLLK